MVVKASTSEHLAATSHRLSEEFAALVRGAVIALEGGHEYDAIWIVTIRRDSQGYVRGSLAQQIEQCL